MRRAPSSSDLPPYFPPTSSIGSVPNGSSNRITSSPDIRNGVLAPNYNNNLSSLRGTPSSVYQSSSFVSSDPLTEIRASLGPPRTAAASASRAGYSPAFAGGGENMQIKPDHSGGKKQPEHMVALQQIRQSLQPYYQASDGGAGNCDTLSSESSSGTNGSDYLHLESEMLQQLVTMGFDKEASWYALKLTQFRSIPMAVEILLKTQSSSVFDNTDQKNGVRKQSYENGLDSGSSRSESPRIPSPSGPYLPSSRSAQLQPQHGGSQIFLPQKAVSPLGRVGLDSQSQLQLKRSQMNLNLKEVSVNGNGNVSDYSLQQSQLPIVQAVSSKRVERPQAQSAISPTVVNVTATPNAVFQARNSPDSPVRPQKRGLAPKLDPEPLQTVKINVQPSHTSEMNCSRTGDLTTQQGQMRSYQMTSNQVSAASIQRIPIIDDNPFDPSHPTDKRYIEDLCRRVSNLLGSQSPLGKRDSTASSAGSEGDSQGPSFASLLQVHGRSSPVSSLSTESSTESGNRGTGPAESAPPVVRSESPLPESVAVRLHSSQQHREAAVKPCTPKAFKFYMEQHIENVIKQHKDRLDRYWRLEHELETAMFHPPTREQMRQLLIEKESRYLRLKRQRIIKSMFEKISTIGVGAFGEVALVRKKDTKLLYAMKILKKSDIIKKNQAAHVKAERDILSEADNEWVVKLYYSFQSRDNLYFIMEYIPGGDMMSLLIKKGIFEQDLARFYIAELVCAIGSVHRLGFIHRDIKPDNILIDKDGHIKLTDFGLCTGLRWTHDNKYYHPDEESLWNAASHSKQDSFDLLCKTTPNPKLLEYRHKRTRQKAHSLVGTPNYIAPEVLMRTGHTQLCDWWSVGVICFEMVVGYPPFLANSPLETQFKVIHWKETLQIPPEANLSPSTENFILSLCCGAENRLGRHSGADEIKMHPYFQGVPFDTLRQSPAPYKPEILNETDTSNFDPVESRPDSPGADAKKTTWKKQENANATGMNGWKKEGNEHTFYEFTFRRFFDSDPMGCPTIKGTPPPKFNQRPSLGPLMEQVSPSSSTSHSANISILRINTASDTLTPEECVACNSSNASTLVEEELTEPPALRTLTPPPTPGTGEKEDLNPAVFV